MFDDRLPPMVSLSAPVCFCEKVHGFSPAPVLFCRYSSSCGHCTPDSSSISPRCASKARTLLSLRMSSITAWSAKGCPPMEWRPPAMQIDFSSVCASLKAVRTSSIARGSTILNTRAPESCEWTSLTRMPSTFFAALGSAIWPKASPFGNKAAATPIFRKSRRFNMSRHNTNACTRKYPIPSIPAKSW